MDLTVQTVAKLFTEAHQQLREAVADLEPAELNWTPGPETNPISVLVVHTLGSEAEVLKIVRGITSDRDRDAEFVAQPETAAELLARLDAADAFLDEQSAAMTAADLSALRERPNREPRQGIYWLLNNYGHAREHLAHISLTKQLLRQGDAAAS